MGKSMDVADTVSIALMWHAVINGQRPDETQIPDNVDPQFEIATTVTPSYEDMLGARPTGEAWISRFRPLNISV